MKTYVNLNGKISPEIVANIINEKCGKNTVSYVQEYDYGKIPTDIGIEGTYDNSDHWKSENGFIELVNDENAVFYSYTNLKDYQKALTHPELADMITTETTYLSMGYTKQAQKMLTEIAEEFGGWLGSDNEENQYKYIEKRER